MPSQPNQSLINGLACLQAAAAADTALGSREIARHTGLHPTRANRLLNTLAEIGLLEQDAHRKYRAGPGLHVLAAQSLVGSGMLPAALPVVRALREQGFTVAVGVLWRELVCFLIHARIGQQLEEAIGSHAVRPADTSSLGLALLAHQDELPAIEQQPAHAALLDPPSLAEAVAATRRDGYAVRRYRDGTTSIGVAFGAGPDLPPYAGLAVSARHLDAAAVPAIADDLHAAAARIERALATPSTASHPELLGALL